MIQITIEQSAVGGVHDYIERTRQRIFEKMREGMKEAMEGLAAEAVAEAGAAGIEARTGQLFEDILASPRVRETESFIIGRVTTKSEMTSGGRKFKGYLGTALDEGYRVPSVNAKLLRFVEPDGETFYRMGHQAFDVKPHPFLHRAKEAFTAPILEIIQRKVAEAYQ